MAGILAARKPRRKHQVSGRLEEYWQKSKAMEENRTQRRHGEEAEGHPGVGTIAGKEAHARTLREMLDPSIGSLPQRAIKWYIRPRLNPERTIALMEAAKIDYFPRMAKAIGFRGYAKIGNYTMEDTSLSSLVNMATKGTVFNEAVHTLGSMIGVVLLGLDVAMKSDLASFAFDVSIITFSSIPVFAQWYTRARLEITINRAIKSGQTYDSKRYGDYLHIRKPEKSI